MRYILSKEQHLNNSDSPTNGQQINLKETNPKLKEYLIIEV